MTIGHTRFLENCFARKINLIMSCISDRELIKQSIDGDSQAFSILIKRVEAPPNYAEAAHLFYLEGLTIRQIAVRLGKPEGTIKRWLSHTRSFVRSRLGLRQIRTERRKIMTSDAHESEYYQRRALRDIAACREDGAASLNLKNPVGSKELPSEVWTLTQLKDLSLWWNNLESISEEIGRLKHLESLYVESDQLKQLPNQIVSLSRLRHLEVIGGQMTELPADFCRLSALRTVIFQRTQLQELPASFGDLNRLEVAEMDNNQFSKLPDELSGLTNLRVLTLQSHQLSVLPKTLGQLSAMEELYLDYNHLDSLPEEICNLRNLETLAIANNQIHSLPPCIGNFSKLQYLFVESNQLANIPREIGQLTELRELALSNNQLTSLPKALADLPNLQILKLHDNPLPDRLIQAAENGIDEFRRAVAEVTCQV